MSTSSDRWQQARNILAIRLDYLGDVLMTTPALRALRNRAGGRITLLTSPGGAAVAPCIPEIDDTIVYAAPWLKHSEAPDAARDLAMIETLRARRFDAAVIFTVYSQNPLPAALLCHLAGIPLRLAHCRENPYQLLSDWVAETEPQQQVRHEVRRQLDLVATVGARCEDERLSFCVPDTAQEAVRAHLARLHVRKRFIVLHPGASAASRRYPAASFRRAAELLSRNFRHPLVFTGSTAEAPLIDEIRAGLPDAHSLAGRLSLAELGALLREAALVVTNNTGPAHLAAAIGTPVVDLYALTNPQHTPWQVPARVLFQDVSCRYCYRSACPMGHQACLASVAPERVLEAAAELLGGARDSRPALPPL
ncbi:MAG TPA: lipopolysaccharide heptosyltransferase II [Noviherbaspirillum sp.]|nr:lipopolysaccharide heptosyltransferase II [Noviherbaspirillum sp.]